MAKPRYNGHKDWEHWNVSLWINNDENLYRAARECVNHNLTKSDAAYTFIQIMQSQGFTKTPDGAVYTVQRVRAAMQDM
jgi:hypothetical protein